MLFISTVAVLLQLSFSSAGDPCPSKFALAPCTCTYASLQNRTFDVSSPVTTRAPVVTPLTTPTGITPAFTPIGNDSSYTVVNCKVSKSIQALEEIISTALNRKLVDKLIVANVPPRKEHTLARLPSGWLKTVRVRQFEVMDSRLSGDFIWYGNPFEGQAQSLLWFSAKKCSLTGALTFDTYGTVHTKGLNVLPHIQGVDFSHNYLTAIMSQSFRHPPTNMSYLDLSYNSIQYVEVTALQYIQGLRQINLSHNRMENLVSRSIFASPARRLEVIDLSWNSLTTLPVDLFVNMPALKIVNVSNNFLYTMPEKPWGTVWKQLEHIDLTGNFVECNCDLLWLLSILSPKEVNATTTPAPTPLPGQTVLGSCSKTVNPLLFAIKYDLVTLTRDRLSC